MIVRISEEGQFRLEDSLHGELDRLDDAIVAAVQAGDEDRYRQLYTELLAIVRKGQPVPAAELLPSDIVLPADNLTFEEAQRHFREEGLVPD
jgi:hypothetical protein